MSRPRWAPQTADIPRDPGVYRFCDGAGRVLYVGKAKNLRARLSGYFTHDPDRHPRTVAMLQRARSVSWTVLSSDREALIVEADWISSHDPVFNVRLRHGGTYPGLMLTGGDVPRLVVWRGRSGSRPEFGPWPDVNVAKLAEAVGIATGIATCTRSTFTSAQTSQRACLLGQIGRCAAPCVSSTDDYAHVVATARRLLNGDGQEHVTELTERMHAAAAAQSFEQAALWRDRAQAVAQVTATRSRVTQARTRASAVAAVAMPGGAAWACVQVHDGVVMAVHTGTAALSEGSVGQAQASDLQEVRVRVAAQYAASSGRTALAAEAGAGLRRARSKDEQAVLALAERNAAEMARTAALRRSHDPQASARAANELAGVLGMVNAPIRVECWDISHLQGRSPRAGVAVHVDGVARREQFRAYKVPERHGGDDYASMRWLAGRRGPSLDADLVLVDGGPGQVQAVTDVLHDELGLAVAVAGIAKRMEELYLPGQDDPVILSRSSPALWLVQAVRDDAHNTAISAHRKDRDKKLTRDPLLDVPGVGPKLAAAIRRAGVDPSTASEAELASIPGVGTHTAERIVAAMSAPG